MTLTNSFTHLLTSELTPWKRVLEKLIIPQVVKKFAAYNGTWRPINRHLSVLGLRSIRSIQSFLSHPIFILSILIYCPPIYAHAFQVVAFLQVFPTFPSVCLSPLPLYTRDVTCPAHLVLTNLISRIITGEDYKTRSFHQWPVTSYFLGSYIFLGILFCNTVSLCSTLRLICSEVPNFAGRKRVNLFIPRWQTGRQETLDRMITGLPWIWSALNFSVRAYLICWRCSRIFEPCHIDLFTEFFTYILSCIVCAIPVRIYF